MIKENYIFFDIDAKNKEEALDFISSKKSTLQAYRMNLQYLTQSQLTLRKLLFSLLSVRTNLIGKH